MDSDEKPSKKKLKKSERRAAEARAAALRRPYLAGSELKQRGWTDALIERFLGEPDEIKRNPVFRSAGAPMRLYSTQRVLLQEATPEFLAAKEKASERSARAKAVADKKREELCKLASKMHISIEVLTREELLSEAIEHYNEHYDEQNDDWDSFSRNYRASEQSDEGFLRRIECNYARHVLTDYDEELEKMFRQVGVHEATAIFQGRIYQIIANKYPHLAAECKRQRRARAEARREHKEFMEARALGHAG